MYNFDEELVRLELEKLIDPDAKIRMPFPFKDLIDIFCPVRPSKGMTSAVGSYPGLNLFYRSLKGSSHKISMISIVGGFGPILAQS